MPTANSTNSLQHQLQSITRRFESTLRDLRTITTEVQRDSASKGVLGSRGLTQFVVEQLQTARQATAETKAAPNGFTVSTLLEIAERAGYAIPTARTLSKRLTERAYRMQDIAFDGEAQVWYWRGTDLQQDQGADL